MNPCHGCSLCAALRRGTKSAQPIVEIIANRSNYPPPQLAKVYFCETSCSPATSTKTAENQPFCRLYQSRGVRRLGKHFR